MSSDLRKQLRAARQALSPKEREQKSLAIARHLAGYLPYRRARRIAFYMPTTEEVDAGIAIAMALAMAKQVYLPVVNRSRLRDSVLLFHHYDPDITPLKKNRYGIDEPVHLVGQCLRSNQLDLICVPMVGFNPHCDRIGMGAGFYDRTLGRQHYRQAELVGLAFACQRADFVPAAHDVPMQAVVTEDGILRPERRRIG